MRSDKLSKLLHSLWLFPALLFAVVCLLTAFKISGSSVGMFNQFLYGKDYHDPALVYGQPRPIRSDEWLVVTGLTVAQSRNHFQAFNPNFGGGQRMDITFDTPHKNWSEVFQPQNWSFFVLPLEFAFAFKWWLMGWLLIASCYLFIRTLLPDKPWFAVFLSLSVFFGGAIQWWYQFATLAPFYYGFFILTVFLQLRASKNPRARWLWATLLMYLLAALALVQYPPFVLPVAITVGAFMVGSLLEQPRKLKQTVLPLAAAGVAALGWLAAFVLTRLSIFRLVTRTEYPGHRLTESYDISWWHLLSGYLGGQLQNTERALHYFANQSEASSFVLIAPFLVLPSLYVIVHSFRAKSPRRYTLLLLNAVLVVFMLRLVVRLTGSNSLSSLIRIVPNNRIMLGIGFVSVVQMAVLARDQVKTKYPKLFIIAGTAVTGLLLVYAGLAIKHAYPGYVGNSLKIVALALVVTASFYLFITKRIVASAAVLLLLAVMTTYRVNPLYRGLGPYLHTPLASKVSMVNAQHPGGWIMLDSLEFNTFLPAQGIDNYSGVYIYPQFATWDALDPTHQNHTVFNRFAQAIFSDYAPARIYLQQMDTFHIKFDACGAFEQQHLSYILSVHETSSPCLSPVDAVHYPAKSFYIYKLQPPGGL